MLVPLRRASLRTLRPSGTWAASAATRHFCAPTPTRLRAARFLINLEDPDQGLHDVRERIRQLTQEDRLHTAAHYHALINIALCHYNKGDFALARECATYAHDTIVANRGPHHSMLYFSAMTCSKCAGKLAAQMEAQNEEDDRPTDGLLPGVSKALSGSRFAKKLRDEEKRFLGIARRIQWLPQNGFARSSAESRAYGWEETDSSTQHSRDARDASEAETMRRKERRKRPEFKEIRRTRRNQYGVKVPK